MATSESQSLTADGGIGHELKRRGVVSSDGTFVAGVLQNEINDSLTNKKPNVVESIHTDYLAHCDVITTNSFVAVPQRMIESGLSRSESYPYPQMRAAQLIIAAVCRAKTAITKHNAKLGEDDNDKIKQKKMIAGCIPPLTECYMSNKVSTNIDLLINEYKVILSTLIIDCQEQESVCQVDVLLAETLSTTREAQAIIRSLAIIQQQKTKHIIPPLWISFTVHDNQPTKLRSDESLVLTCQSIIQEASELNITLKAIGINCSSPNAISESIPILVQLVEGMDIQVIAYGNCFKNTTSEWIERSLTNEENAVVTDGSNNACTLETRSSTEIMDNKTTCDNNDDYDDNGILTVDAYSRYACEWARLGARIIGGCCGCSPMHMQQVAIALKAFEE